MKYQNIIFDFGNVLVKFDEQQVIGRFCPTPEDFPLMKRAIFHNWDELDRGTIDYGEYMEQAASLLPKRLHPCLRQISLEWCRYLSPLQKTWDFIKELKEQGFSLYILSNASTFFAEHTDYYEITREFDGIVFSGYLQMLKPGYRTLTIFWNPLFSSTQDSVSLSTANQPYPFHGKVLSSHPCSFHQF